MKFIHCEDSKKLVLCEHIEITCLSDGCCLGIQNLQHVVKQL